MKTFLKVLIIGVIGSLTVTGVNCRGELEVGASVEIHAKADFYAPLTPYGTWIDVHSYGRCWRPSHVAPDWEPYCDGSWVWTDCGWYWDSDEPWGWACCHYGYWVYDDDYGWIWVPGVVWGPAWVSWRVGDGYMGWAPLPPPGVFFTHTAAPRFFVFVKEDRFTDHIRPSIVVRNDPVIVKRTKSINHIRRVTRTVAGERREVVVNNGPGVEIVDKATHRKIAAVPIREAAAKARIPSREQHHTGGDTIQHGSPTKDAVHASSPNGAEHPVRGRPPETEEPHARPGQRDQRHNDRGGSRGGRGHDKHAER